MTIDENKYLPVVEPEGDRVHRLVRAAIGLIPLGSGTVLEIFNAIITPPVEERRDEWMREITTEINELYERNILENGELLKNDEFISILIHASQLAIKNHQEDKLEALRNVVLHSLIPSDLSIDKKFSFLGILDQITPTHIHVLKVMKNGLLWASHKEHTSKETINFEISTEVRQNLSIETADQQFIAQVVRDLESKNFFHTVNLGKKNEHNDGVVQGGKSTNGAFVIGLEIDTKTYMTIKLIIILV